MRVIITIDTDNAAFEPPNTGPEVARILGRVAGFVGQLSSLDPGDTYSCCDANGHRVGQLEVIHTDFRGWEG